MRIAVFTSNQPRHIALLDALIAAGHDVVATIEPKTYLPPISPILAEYWGRVRRAETDIFGERFLSRVPTMAVRPGELSALPWLMWKVDRQPVVFSASYITGEMADRLLRHNAVNLHVGVAPEYRGSAPNAWAWHDGNHHLIGAQVQRLSKGLDAGDILAEVRVGEGSGDYFLRSMLAVKLGIDALVALLDTPEPWATVRANNREQQIRYSRHAQFTEEIAAKIMETSG